MHELGVVEGAVDDRVGGRRLCRLELDAEPMSEKYLRVTMPDKSEWDIPARLIAEDRAHYYADRDAKEDSGQPSGPAYGKVYARVFAEQVEHALSSEYEITDWAGNSMNWVDVAAHATMAVPPPADTDYQEGWCNGEKQVIER